MIFPTLCSESRPQCCTGVKMSSSLVVTVPNVVDTNVVIAYGIVQFAIIEDTK